MFIGYVNKLRSNFRHLQPHVLINLFKAYCCSFYRSQLWKFNSVGIDKCCKSWNIAVRTLLGLPYNAADNAHTYLLGPIMDSLIFVVSCIYAIVILIYYDIYGTRFDQTTILYILV